jgi:hypothetical protein
MFDWLFALSVVLLLAGPMIAIVALVRSIGINDRLRGLESKFAALERQMAAVDLPPPQTTARPAATPPRAVPGAAGGAAPRDFVAASRCVCTAFDPGVSPRTCRRANHDDRF